jgi:hypothetical protein
MTIPMRVTTLDKKENIRLYVDQSDNHSNVSFCDIPVGSSTLNSIVYCISHTYMSSPGASWALLVVRDQSMRIANLRLFDYDYNKYNFSGMYIKVDLRRTDYGFTTKLVYPMDNEIPDNPEIQIAYDHVLQQFAEQEDVLDFITTSRILDTLKSYVDVERGYLLVKLAMELNVADSLINLTSSVNREVIKKALIFDKAFVTQSSTTFSKSFKNVITASQSQITHRKEVISLLDPETENKFPEQLVYKEIKDFVTSIIKTKKEAFL